MARFSRLAAGALVVVLVIACSLGVAGYFLFTRPHEDPLSHADAIVVLGGDRDGRIEYGLELARQGYAGTVVLSNAYGNRWAKFQQACASGTPTLTVICFTPDPFTTLGEAIFTARLARHHGWTHVIVVSWNFHMVRARYIFHQCFDGAVTMRPVPGTYDYSVTRWGMTYLYQYGAMVKAAILGCR